MWRGAAKKFIEGIVLEMCGCWAAAADEAKEGLESESRKLN